MSIEKQFMKDLQREEQLLATATPIYNTLLRIYTKQYGSYPSEPSRQELMKDALADAKNLIRLIGETNE